MFSFLLRKISSSFFVLFGVILIIFFLFFVVMPAHPARLTMGQRSDAKTLKNIRKELYLDLPIQQQFLKYINDLSPISLHLNNEEEKEKYNYQSILNLGENTMVLKKPYLLYVGARDNYKNFIKFIFAYSIFET